MSTIEKIKDITVVDKWRGKPCMIHTVAVKAKDKHQAPSIENYHVEDLGWDHIGYMFVIERDGTIYFSKPTADKQYHCKGGKQNFESFGIAMSGHGDIQFATMEQMLSLEKILTAYSCNEIRYHRDFSNKSCPGVKLAKILEQHELTKDKIKRY